MTEPAAAPVDPKPAESKPDERKSDAPTSPEPPPARPLSVVTEPARSADAKTEASRGGRALAAVAVKAARSVKRTADGAAARVEADDAAWAATEAQADLPELRALADGGDPIEDLARRADREADFFRTIAVRTLRPGPGRALALLAGAVALLGGTVMAIAAGVRAFFGAGIGETPGAEAAALALMLGMAATVGLLVERERHARAHAALARAELAERRIERAAGILALRAADPKRFVDALTRIEREPTR